MKFSSTLSLIIGSFFVAVKGQEITANLGYTVSIDGVSNSYYALECNAPDLPSNHPMATQACRELSEYVRIAAASEQTIATVLHNALSPPQPILDPSPCAIIGGEAALNIFFGQINNEVITSTYGPVYLNLRYPDGCVMKMIEEQAKLAHLVPFFATKSIPVPPLSS